MEITSHHLGQLTSPTAFAFDVGLVHGREPSKKIMKLLVNALSLDGSEDVKCSIESRFSPLASCRKNDMVLFNDGDRFKVGQVNIHCEIEGAPISMVSVYRLVKHNAAHGHSILEALDADAQFIETERILDTVVYSRMPANRVDVLLPLEYR